MFPYVEPYRREVNVPKFLHEWLHLINVRVLCEIINQTRSYRGRKERFRVISNVNLMLTAWIETLTFSKTGGFFS